MKRIFTLIIVALAMATGAYAYDLSWEFSSLADQTISETTNYNGLTIYATSSKTVTIDSSSKTFDGTSYTYRLKLGGAGSISSEYRVLAFDVDGNCDITVHCLSSSSSADRTLTVVYGDNSTALTSIPAYGSIDSFLSTEATISYSGDATTIYMYSGESGINIYGIYVEYTGYTKSIPSYGYASFSADTDVDVPEGVTVYIATEVGDEEVYLTSEDTDVIPANTGVILAGNEGSYILTISSSANTADFSENILIASSESPTVGEEDDGYTYYGLNAAAEDEAEFAVITNGTKLSGNKAYLKVKGDSSEAKSLKISLSNATGISKAATESATSDGAVYSLQGIKVSSPSKGVYIQDGKKVLIK